MKTHLRARTFLSVVGAFVLVFSVFGMASPGVMAQGRSAARAGQPAWSTYADLRFDFTIEYPADWYVHPRNDEAGGYGGTVRFTDLPDDVLGSQTRKAVVEVGFHLSEIEPGQALSAWQDLYHEALQRVVPDGREIVERTDISTPQWKGLRARGSSIHGEFHVAEIPNGRIVWFIWSNSTGKELDVYHHMVRSLTFGPASPRDLREAYGEDFQPAPLEASDPVIPAGPDPGGPSPAELGFRLPFSGPRPISQGPGCGPSHYNELYEAIDYSMYTGCEVKATYNGKVYWAASDGGWGNVIRIRHTGTGYVSTYAHLSRIDVGVDRIVTKGQVIGLSGNTGTSTDAHLHFDVRFDGGPTAGIRTLSGTVWCAGPVYPCEECSICVSHPCYSGCGSYYGKATGP